VASDLKGKAGDVSCAARWRAAEGWQTVPALCQPHFLPGKRWQLPCLLSLLHVLVATNRHWVYNQLPLLLCQVHAFTQSTGRVCGSNQSAMMTGGVIAAHFSALHSN
jgi:hypothetical protein